MDDEETIRKISGKLLHALGHECEFAEKGESAVAMFKSAREEGRPFDLVILDQGFRLFLKKPYHIEELREAINSASGERHLIP